MDQQTPTQSSKKRPRKSPDQRLAELEQTKAALELKIAGERKKARDQERKDDTREKFILGAIALENMRHDESFAELMNIKIRKYMATARETKRAQKDKVFLEMRARKRAEDEL